MSNLNEDELNDFILSLSSLPSSFTNLQEISKLLKAAEFDPNPLIRSKILNYISYMNNPEFLPILSRISANDKDLTVRKTAMDIISRLRSNKEALKNPVSYNYFFNYFYKQLDEKFNNLRAEFTKALELDTELIEEVGQILQDSTQDFTADTLWKTLSTRFTWEDYSRVLAHLQKTGKLYIELDGYISWLWSPKLIEKFKKNELILK